MTTRLACVLLLTSLVACGGDDNNTPVDGAGSGSGSNVPAMITITGKSQEVSTSTTPLSGVTIGAYQSSDENTAVATATSDTSGNYTLTITTNGHPLDGYIKASIAGYLDTYLYPPSVISADYNGASLNIVKESTLELLSNLCQHSITNAQGAIAVEVADASMTAVSGATVSSSPTAMKYCYNGSTPGIPDSSKTSTGADGLAYMIDVTGDVTVSAMKSGTTFASHKVKVRTNSVTTTLITP